MSPSLAIQHPKARKVNIRRVALPTEHGGWAFVLNPILLGLLVVPSLDGLLLGVAALCTFLIHQPFKQWWSDYRVKRKIARTPIARNFALAYAVVAALAAGYVISQNAGAFLLPLALAVPLGITQQMYDAQGRSRELVPELCGALALSAVGPAIAVLGGWDLEAALLLWLLLIVWVVTAIFYVRVRLRLEKGRLNDYDLQYVALVHGVGLLLVGLAWYNGALPFLAWVAVGMLAARAAWGLSALRRRVNAIRIGIGEVLIGLLYLLVCAVGYADRF